MIRSLRVKRHPLPGSFWREKSVCAFDLETSYSSEVFISDSHRKSSCCSAFIIACSGSKKKLWPIMTDKLWFNA